ncbi:NAD(P)-binding protein, partial [Burkholderia anthina]
MLEASASTSPQPVSLWRALAAESGALASGAERGAGPLDRELRTEIAIVGAGYSGLAAAHALRQRGVACVVLD